MIRKLQTISHSVVNFQVEVGDVYYKWKYDEGEVKGWQPVSTLHFQKAKR